MKVLIETERLVLRALDDSCENRTKVLNFLNKGRDIFEKYEMDALLMVMNFSEDFLNKYFFKLH